MKMTLPRDYDAFGFFGTAHQENDWRFPSKRSKNDAENSKRLVGTMLGAHAGDGFGGDYNSSQVRKTPSQPRSWATFCPL